jgi:O-glycosyl hydrolase
MALQRGLALLLAAVASQVCAQVTVTVNVAQTFQTMDGFGFSEAFGRANDIKGLPAAMQKQALDMLFSTTTGAGMTILRNRIGSGGAGDSIEPTSPGSPIAAPAYVWDNNDSGQVWFSQQAQSYGVNTFYADPWSAPGFMKTNGNEANGGFLCGVTGETCASGDWKQAYANFLVQYVKFYAQAGINITHLGIFNEPDFTCVFASHVLVLPFNLRCGRDAQRDVLVHVDERPAGAGHHQGARRHRQERGAQRQVDVLRRRGVELADHAHQRHCRRRR